MGVLINKEGFSVAKEYSNAMLDQSVMTRSASYTVVLDEKSVCSSISSRESIWYFWRRYSSLSPSWRTNCGCGLIMILYPIPSRWSSIPSMQKDRILSFCQEGAINISLTSFCRFSMLSYAEIILSMTPEPHSTIFFSGRWYNCSLLRISSVHKKPEEKIVSKWSNASLWNVRFGLFTSCGT